MRLLILTGLVCAATAASADSMTVFSKNRAKLFARQTELLDGRAAQQYSNSVRLQPKPVRVPGQGGAAPFTGSYDGEYVEVARMAARRHSIPEDLFLRLVQRESGWNPRARSHKGALGLAQLMPTTAARLAVDPLDPVQNLDGGARYLKRQFERFRSWPLALAAYNAGPEAVARHGGIPPYRETQDYVRVVWGD